MEARTDPRLRILALVPDAFGDPHGRLGGIALYNRDVLSMPDTWEYPWYAAWDLAFHTIALALADRLRRRLGHRLELRSS